MIQCIEVCVFTFTYTPVYSHTHTPTTSSFHHHHHYHHHHQQQQQQQHHHSQLEVLRNNDDGRERGSLVWLMDHTKTAFGGRLLRAWVGRPLNSRDAIHARHDAVQCLVDCAAGHTIRGVCVGGGVGVVCGGGVCENAAGDLVCIWLTMCANG